MNKEKLDVIIISFIIIISFNYSLLLLSFHYYYLLLLLFLLLLLLIKRSFTYRGHHPVVVGSSIGDGFQEALRHVLRKLVEALVDIGGPLNHLVELEDDAGGVEGVPPLLLLLAHFPQPVVLENTDVVLAGGVVLRASHHVLS